jgi:micrococcal nuclease
VVTEVVDGDTIKVSIGGDVYTVRYIGIDTPETVHPTRGVEPYGAEASAANRRLVEGQTVRLERDVSETDRYGRLLRYVWVGDVMVNAELVRLGYAQVSTYPPDVARQEEFSRLEAEAREAGRGLWADAPEPTPTLQSRDGCDPAYPDVCIAPPPPDLNCGDIVYRQFRVLAPDPHRFDGDGNGVGCETD